MEFFEVIEGGYNWQLAGNEEDGYRPQNVDGITCEIRFNGKRVAVVTQDLNSRWEYRNDVKSCHVETSDETVTVDVCMCDLNAILEILTDEDYAKGMGGKLEAFHRHVGESESCIYRYETWKDYFNYLGELDELTYQIIDETLLPDFKALRQGKFVYQGKLIAEI